ncbi:MAG TPA: alpha/beta hydrolase [Leptolyngbyaceae cyanobacterium]
MTTTMNSPIANSTPIPSRIGGKVEKYSWKWENQSLNIVYETLGEGTPVLLLPAFSTVSTRGEMRGLAEGLASQFHVVALDWPGFGESDRLPLDYRPELYHQFLSDFVKSVFNTSIIAVAAGHAAGYAMQLAVSQPDVFSKIVLVAPTWRGPLPTMGAKKAIADTVRETVRSPLLGQALYKMNTVPSFLKFMYRQHVYADPANLSDDFIQAKYQITQQPGARFAPAAFVTGTLDPVRTREDFLAMFQSLPAPLMVIIGEQAPRYSKAEMEALAQVPGVQSVTLTGSLGLHEEYAAAVIEAIQPFLA